MKLSRSGWLLTGFIFFLCAGLLTAYFASKVPSSQALAGQLSERLTHEISEIDEEASAILKTLAQGKYNEIGTTSRHAFFVFSGTTLVRWTDNSFVPSYASVADGFALKLLRAGNSDYLAKKWPIDDRTFLIGIVSLDRKYPITNDYLKPWWNEKIFTTRDINILEENNSLGIPVCVAGSCPFRVLYLERGHSYHETTDRLAVVSVMLSIVLFLMWIYGWIARIPYPEARAVLLYLVLLGIRQLMVTMNFPAAFIPGDLFNPQIFASSVLNGSLGDLFLNELALLFLCYYIFKHYHKLAVIRWASRNRIVHVLLSVFAALCVLLAALFPFVVVQTLFNNSSVTLDITQSVSFDSLRLIVLLIVLIAGISSFLFMHAFVRILTGDRTLLRISVVLLIAVAMFVGVNLYTGQFYQSSLIVALLYFVVIYMLRLYGSLQQLNFATFAYLFTAVFFFSANTAYGIQYFSRKEKIEDQFRFANNYLVDRDVFGEYLLAETATEIARDVFIQTRLSSVFLSRDAVRQKIRQVFLPEYFNKYDVDIFLFNGAGESLDGLSERSFPELIAQYDKDAYRTSHPGVFFVNNPIGDVAQQYLVKIPVARLQATSGYIVLELSLKKIIPESVYPELLVDNQVQQYYRAQNFSYAVLSDSSVLFRSGNFNYEQQFNWSWLGEMDIHFVGMNINGYDHVAQEDDNGRIAIVSSEQSPLAYKLANFSFLIVCGLSILLLFIVGQGALNYWRGNKLYFAARIQLFMNLAFFLPLIIVSVITLQLINRSSQNQLNEEYLNKARTVGEQLASRMSEPLEDSTERSVGFANRVTNLAKLANLDLNVYTPRGVLLATSQPAIVSNGLLSNYINAEALQRITRGDNLFIETERVGTLTFFVSYTALKSPVSGRLIGILGIPFFRSGISLQKVQINILANILNIFTVIFMALIVLAYFVSKWLTFPLNFITQSLRKTSLTRINQPLVWKADDEIGLMVKEYNQMLYNLSESKAELEQTQRERTWREIAQQVAHEIKNPLTPMKLSLQQLERNLQGGTLSPEKTAKAVSSLLTQVDTLNDIASSFSSFAKMPEPVMHPLDVVGLMRRIIDLHSHAGGIVFTTSAKELRLSSDEQLLGRTFSNIILNAFQAARAGHALKLTIAIQKKNDNRVLISFEDNGKGIEAAVADRIFTPHFTTKKSGSGLGLAITRQAIEQMKGRIWFETEPGKGTTFFIELPC